MSSNNLNLEELKNKSRSNDPAAQYKLAKLYKEGKHVEKNIDQYKKLLEESAKNGHSDAIYELGDCYASGIGVEKNESAAISWYTQAIKEGNVAAHYKMGLILLTGINSVVSGKAMTNDLIKAEKLLRFAANKNNSDAQYQLGMLYQMGTNGLKKDFIESERWLVSASKLGNLDSQNAIAYLYAHGSEDGKIREDLPKAMKWWREASIEGHAEAQYNLAVSYAKEAISYWQKSSNLGNEKSAYMLNQISSFEWDK